MLGIKSGDKVTISIASGLAWPGVAVSDEVVTRQWTKDRGPGRPSVEIDVTRFDVISLRETDPAKGEVTTYTALTNEVGQFGFRPSATARHSTVIGLDVEEDGTLIDVQGLLDKHQASFSAFQNAQFLARHAATDAADL
jgi:hypothetical protein